MPSSGSLAVAGALLLLSFSAVAQPEQKVYVLDAIDGDSLQVQRDGGALGACRT